MDDTFELGVVEDDAKRIFADTAPITVPGPDRAQLFDLVG